MERRSRRASAWSIDLTGDGKTVLKANYGLYWHNPGVGIGGNANPNTASKSATYTWNDLNGDRRWQPGEAGCGVRRPRGLEGAIGLDPNIKAPYTHEASVWFEQQLSDDDGRARRLRLQDRRRSDRERIQPGVRPRASSPCRSRSSTSASTVVRGTADDRNLTFYGIPTATFNTLDRSTQSVTNVDQYARYKTFEVSVNRRYAQQVVGVDRRRLHDADTTSPTGAPADNPNNPGVDDRTSGTSRRRARTTRRGASASRRCSVTSRASNYARTLTITAAGGGLTGATRSTTAYAEATDDNREDNICVFDIRAEKQLTFTPRVRLRLMFDAFNLANSHASETIGRATGLSYQKPALILAPRTARVGFRFIF